MRLGFIWVPCVFCVVAACGEDDGGSTADTRADTTAPDSDTGQPETVAETTAETGEETAADTEDTGSPETTPSGPNFTCLGEDRIYDPGNNDIELYFRLVDYDTGSPVPGVHGKFCARVDPDCDNPIDEADSDADGIMRATVPPGFDGQIEGEGGGIAPLIQMVDAPIISVASPTPVTVSLATPATATALGQLLGTALDPAAGQIIVSVRDCDRATAAGVAIELAGAPDTQDYGYIAAGLPSPDATATDESGAAGALNVPPGLYTVRGTTAEGESFGRGQALVRAGWITQMFIAPHQTTPDLLCNGDPALPVAFEGEGSVRVRIADFISNADVAGAQFKACALSDLACATPLFEAVSDSDGSLDWNLTFDADGFEGFVQVTGTDLLPTRLFFHPPFFATGPTTTLLVQIFPETGAEVFAQASGVVIDPELAIVGVLVEDCTRRPAHAATVTISALTESSKIVYLNDGLPDPASTATDDSGLVGIFNVATGEAEVSATFDGDPLGSVTLPLTKGYLHQTNLIPSD